MRYAKNEFAFAPAVLPEGGTVNVTVWNQNASALVLLSNSSASQTLLPVDGEGQVIWEWSLENIQNPIDGMAQLIIQFDHSTGVTDRVKLVVRGYVDNVTKTYKLTSALL